jgi:hypothetical protein
VVPETSAGYGSSAVVSVLDHSRLAVKDLTVDSRHRRPDRNRYSSRWLGTRVSSRRGVGHMGARSGDFGDLVDRVMGAGLIQSQVPSPSVSSWKADQLPVASRDPVVGQGFRAGNQAVLGGVEVAAGEVTSWFMPS